MSLAAPVCLLLSEWISFLLLAVPPRSRRTFVGLLIGCTLNPGGRVTRATGAVSREAHRTTYYKLIGRAHVSAAGLSVRLLQLVQVVFPNELVNLIIDDTPVPRCAKTGPGISIKRDHARRANRPAFMNSRCRVARARLGQAPAIPTRSRLAEEPGQRGKLRVAGQLIDQVGGHVKEARLLVDAWFMRKSSILPLLEQKVRIIGQARRDTALYLPPEPEPERRGPKRKCGRRIGAAMPDTLPAQETELVLYGKMRQVRPRPAVAVARFLRGVPVRAVWCEMRQGDNTWSRPRLILATGAELPARAAVEIYAWRWGIEPLFHNLKRWWGVANLWQQSEAALELWMQVRSAGYALTQSLALKLRESFPLMEIAPWRKGAMIAAGLFGQWLRVQFIGLRVRDACNQKPGNFVMPFPCQDQRLQC